MKTLVVGGAGPGSIGLYAAGLAVSLGSQSVLYVDADEPRRETEANPHVSTSGRTRRWQLPLRKSKDGRAGLATQIG